WIALVPLVLAIPFALPWLDPPAEHGARCLLSFLAPRRTRTGGGSLDAGEGTRCAAASYPDRYPEHAGYEFARARARHAPWEPSGGRPSGVVSRTPAWGGVRP